EGGGVGVAEDVWGDDAEEVVGGQGQAADRVGRRTGAGGADRSPAADAVGRLLDPVTVRVVRGDVVIDPSEVDLAAGHSRRGQAGRRGGGGGRPLGEGGDDQGSISGARAGPGVNLGV